MKYLTEIKFVKTNKLAKEPKCSNVGDIGFDLSSIEDVIIRPRQTEKIDTGIQLAKSPQVNGTMHELSRWSLFLKIEGRSSLASRGIFPVGGIIDNSFRGNIMISLHNSSDQKFEIKTGDRIAQLVLYNVVAPKPNHDVRFVEVAKKEQDETERGEQGFGSSGR